ncbi:dynamin GTPase [Cucurbitaria berberidis CBS 394.84]|uniref:Dynamin GTPase n=1 Tax=Cucurbitaria berberidis CBS 394.84 TaxID=1168544 RepID=A0A9P4GG13_9PLEO|nr:dynamin GTPase [Cucurbitaria berberidis CBS 394.84]KAF1844890.1 dynamin GTPase [Cucurbitaria berberidis CBS 394.84]
MADSFELVSSSLLDKIDRLFACNVGDAVALPQIVVVGDQSSGKSSVLEGLTGLPFPRDSGLCTRFATQITFRRSLEPNITVSIIPAKNSSPGDKERLQGWRKSGLKSLDPQTFADIMTEVLKVMGVESAEGEPRKTFSNDVLRLEIAGPDQEHFSVIDVPGIFKRTTHGLTTKEDMAMVNEMVHDYMSNPRSVILAVIPSNVDIATQEILERAEDIDPDGIRTFGILTKPDLVDKGSESAVMNLVEGKTHQLRLGWHLLRNPGQAELKSTLRGRNESEMEFFDKVHPWSTLDKSKVGIVSLRARLQEILEVHIRREFPKVKVDITQKLKKAESTLQSLGPKRQNQIEYSQYLMEFALEFQRTVSLSVNSDYSRSEILSANTKYRVATEAVNRGQAFANAMACYGHTHSFLYADDKKDDCEGENPEKDTVNTRTMEDHPDIMDLLHENKSVHIKRDQDTLEWLKTEYRSSRGFELGTFDASLLAITMRQQATNWRALALGYISDIISLVHSFIIGVWQQIAPTTRVFDGVKSRIMDDISRMYEVAISQTEFLLSVELEGTPATYNHYFNETLEKCRQDRLRKQLKKHCMWDDEYGEFVKLEDLNQTQLLSNEDHTVVQIHDILRSYYKVARKRFVDCVRMQVADTLLVTGQDTPLTLFSAQFVTGMSLDTLEDIAGEDLMVKRRRDGLEKLIGQLREGKAIIG